MILLHDTTSLQQGQRGVNAVSRFTRMRTPGHRPINWGHWYLQIIIPTFLHLSSPVLSYPSFFFIMKSSILISVVVVSNVIGVFSTPLANLSSSTNATSTAKLNTSGATTTLPALTATPSANATSGAIFAGQFACMVNNPTSGAFGSAAGTSQEEALNAAQSDCGNCCDSVQCVQNGCVTGASTVTGRELFYGSANATDGNTIDNSLNNAFVNCTRSAPVTEGHCISFLTQCSSE